MFYLNKPEDFNSAFEAAGCFIDCRGEILLLHRQNSQSYGNLWGLPSGKIEKNENPLEAMIREIKEETGAHLNPSELEFLKEVYVRYPQSDFTYYMFSFYPSEKFKVRLNPREHKDYKWISPRESLTLQQMPDLDSCIKLVYRI